MESATKNSVNSTYIGKLIKKRDKLRQQRLYEEADRVRDQLKALGVEVQDTKDCGIMVASNNKTLSNHPGIICLFGSGELSPVGRRIHEYLIRDLPIPLRVALLPTPAGFEDNPFLWYQKLKEMLLVGLQNFKPNIAIIDALTRGDANNTAITSTLKKVHYVHTGAGSPTYAVKTLRDSLLLRKLCAAHHKGTVLSFASAAAIALGTFALPVYELYKVGDDLHWLSGLNFFAKWGLNLAIIPHWNNMEGGQKIDTRFCYMGRTRFHKLTTLLPQETTIVGVDEYTALVLNLVKKEGLVLGTGSVTINKHRKKKNFMANTSFPLSELVS